MTAPQGLRGSIPAPDLAEVWNPPPVDLARLRLDLRQTAEREGWSDAEMREIGAEIKSAIDASDDERLRYWAARMAEWRELLASYAPRLRAFEARVRAESSARQGSAA